MTDATKTQVGQEKKHLLYDNRHGAFNLKINGCVSQEELRMVLHELHVHQIELEAQNDELKSIHEKLEASRTRYFNLYNQAPVGYLSLNSKGLVTEANPAAANLAGIPGGAMITQPFTRFIHPEDQDIQYLNCKRLVETGATQVYELRLRRDEAAPLWVRVESAIANDPEGLSCFRVVLSDISERIHAEEAIKTLSNRQKAIIAAIPDIIMEVDRDKRYIWANNPGLEFFGEDVIGKEASHYFAGEQDTYKTIEPLYDGTGDLIYVESWQRRRDGEKRLLAWWCKAVENEHGQRTSWLSSARDITERKKAEEENEKLLAQNQQLQKSKSLGIMAGGIAHHFNNQLFAVIGNIDLALNDPSIGSDTRKLLNEALDAAVKSSRVSGLMLTYLGQSSVRWETFDLSSLCRKNLSLLRSVIPQNIFIESSLDPCGAMIKADARQLQIALTHLVINACESMKNSHDTVHIAVSTASLPEIGETLRFPLDWIPTGDSYACLEVSDTGSGIAESDMEKIFDPFFTTRFSGRGLGLPVVLGTVRAHGGVITVESMEGHGSTFRIYLPLSTEEIAEKTEIQASGSRFKGSGTVLVVDDNYSVLMTAKAMLETHIGFRVLTANDGLEALDLFSRNTDQIRLVICDLTMPNMDGWETISGLRRIKPGMPVIMASGYDMDMAMEEKHDELPQVFLSKPYRLNDLINAVSRALENCPG